MRLQESRGDAVRRHHELLDQILGHVAHVRDQVPENLAVEDGAGLQGLKRKRAPPVAPGPEDLRHPVLGPDVLVKAGHPADGGRQWPRPVEPGRHAVVGQLGLVPHQRLEDGGRFHRAVRPEHHLDHEGDPLAFEVERGQVGGELLRKHREISPRRVDGGRVLARVLIDGRSLPDQGSDLRDGHPKREAVAGQGLGHRKLVEVPRVVVVDRAPEQLAEVPD